MQSAAVRTPYWDIAADIYFPPQFDPSGSYPAIVSVHPIGSCKEQTSGNVYGKALAEAGFVVIVPDASFQGGSGGEPRWIEDPEQRVRDYRDVIDYAQTLPYVDPDRIGILGICGGGGYSIKATIQDKRIKALVSVTGVNFGRLMRALQLFREGIWGQEMSRSQLLYIVASDDASGKLRLEKDRAVVDWPGYSNAPMRVRAEARVRAMIEAAGGTFFSNPFALSTFGGNRIIAHPLGGCGMGADATQGVVAHDGRVFDPTQGPQGVHEGLYVCDGAAIPTAIGVSPLLTITALAERAMALAAQRLQRPLDLDRAPPSPVRDAAM